MEFALRGTLYIAVLSCGVYGFASGVEPPRSDLPLEVVADAPLTGQTTRWDYAGADGRNPAATEGTGPLVFVRPGEQRTTALNDSMSGAR